MSDIYSPRFGVNSSAYDSMSTWGVPKSLVSQETWKPPTNYLLGDGASPQFSFGNAGNSFGQVGSSMGGTTGGGGFMDWFKSIPLLDQFNDDGKPTKKGVLNPAINMFQAGLNTYMGMKNYKLQERMLNQQKHEFDTNLAGQRAAMRGTAENQWYGLGSSGQKQRGSLTEHLKSYGL